MALSCELTLLYVPPSSVVFASTWLYLYFSHQAELRRQNATKEELIDRRADQILEIAKKRKAEDARKAKELAMDLDLDGVPHSGDVLPVESVSWMLLSSACIRGERKEGWEKE